MNALINDTVPIACPLWKVCGAGEFAVMHADVPREHPYKGAILGATEVK